MRHLDSRTFAFALLALTLAASARAEIFTAAIGTLHSICSDADGSSHPRRLELVHSPTAEPFDAEQILLSYDSTHEGTGRRGKVSVEASKRTSDGDTQRLGKLTATADEATGVALGVSAVGGGGNGNGVTRLDPEDLVVWSLSFRKFAPLPKDKCVSILAIVTGSPTEIEGAD